MPSRTPSSSPEPLFRKKRHKRRSRSRSPDSPHSYKQHRHHKHRKRQEDCEDDSDGENVDDHRHKRRDDHTQKHDRRDRDYTLRRSFKKGPRRDHRPIKQEPRDDDYQRDGSGRSRWNRDDQSHHDERHRGRQNKEESESFGEGTSAQGSNKAPEKEKPNFQLSGKLTEETNTFRGVVIKYSEPSEARKPKRRWRLYPFKGDQALPVLHIHRQSAYLLGRDRKVADIPVDHPSCSKQHAVLQFRLVQFERADGTLGHRVRPYIIDLGSTNGTYVNNKRIDSERYVELIEKDVVKFGFSTREYVLLHDNVSTEELEDDDVKE